MNLSPLPSPPSVPPIKVIPIDHSQPPTPYSPRTKKRAAAFTDMRWLKVQEFLEGSNLDKNSKTAYERELKRWLGWTDLGWHEVKSRHLAQYKKHLSETPTTRGRARAKSSVNVAVTALRSFFRWMSTVYPDLVPTNPAAHLKMEKVPLPPPQNLSPEQLTLIWAALDQLGTTRLRDTALVHILRYGGLREEEAVSLNIGSLVEGRYLFIADTKTNEPREVPLPKVAIAALWQYLDWRKAKGEELTADRPLFLSHHQGHKGERLTPGGVYLSIARLGKMTGIEGLHPHLFRHTYASELLRQGLDPKHAMKLTGHADAATFTRYTKGAEMEAAQQAYYRAIGEEP